MGCAASHSKLSRFMEKKLFACNDVVIIRFRDVDIEAFRQLDFVSRTTIPQNFSAVLDARLFARPNTDHERYLAGPVAKL
jgi:hypothetical protein